MDLWQRTISDPPELRTFRDDKPTLLFSWWCTIYSIVIILIRVSGRYVRTERMYAEEGSMLLAIIPLLMRMAFVHVVLLYGTNNTVIGALNSEDIKHRIVGSRLVLASRIMYATYLWTIKYSVSMFLRTLTEQVWQSFHQRLLRYLHIFLAATYLATVISVFAECQPFNHYWQVAPDPGPKCRQGKGHLLTAGTLNVVTNLMLVLFPLPLILRARLPLKDKASILARLGLPLVSVALTCYQMPHVMNQHFSQGTRSLMASLDILVATIVSNAIVLLSLLQDRGYKKRRYRAGTQTELPSKGPFDAGRRRSDSSPAQTKWGSNENLVSILETDSDGNPNMIRMGTIKNSKKSRSSQDKRSVEDLHEPERVRLQDIRIASTWEVSITQK